MIAVGKVPVTEENQEMEVWLTSLQNTRSCPLIYVQSTLVISKSKGTSITFRDIRISTYQICSIEEKTI